MDLEANGHARASNTRLMRIERRLNVVTNTSEQRVAVLRDALADFIAAELAERDSEIALLKHQIAELTQKLEVKTAIDQQVSEIAQRLDARQFTRDESKRGPKGQRGERGARGQRGLPGARGPAGKPAEPPPSIRSWHIDKKTYCVTPVLSNGSALPQINLRLLFKAYHRETRS